MASSGVLALLSTVNAWATDPHVKDYLSNFDFPKWAIIGLASVGFITWLAHGRGQDA